MVGFRQGQVRIVLERWCQIDRWRSAAVAVRSASGSERRVGRVSEKGRWVAADKAIIQ